MQGLEFDDVIVAFEKENEAWKPALQSVDCLRNLRELYVGITRAKKKVIILEKGKFMREFFKELSCDFDKTEAVVAIKDIGKFTSAAEWFDEGMKYFKDENYQLAKVMVSCRLFRSMNSILAVRAHRSFLLSYTASVVSIPQMTMLGRLDQWEKHIKLWAPAATRPHDFSSELVL